MSAHRHPILRAFLYSTLLTTFICGFIYLLGFGTTAIMLPPFVFTMFFNSFLGALNGNPHGSAGYSGQKEDTDWEDYFLAQGDFQSAALGTYVGSHDD